MSNAETLAADDWWGSLTESRRAQIHQWITGGGHGSLRDPMPGEDPLPPEVLFRFGVDVGPDGDTMITAVHSGDGTVHLYDIVQIPGS